MKEENWLEKDYKTKFYTIIIITILLYKLIKYDSLHGFWITIDWF